MLQNIAAKAGKAPSEKMVLLEDILGASRCPQALVDQHCLLRYANAAAYNLFRMQDAVILTQGGRIRSQCALQSDRLGVTIRAANENVAGENAAGQVADSVIAFPRPGRFPVLVFVSPLRNDIDADASVSRPALLTFKDPEYRAPLCLSVLERTFELTPAELRLVASLHAGVPLKTIAADHGVSYSTARTHLRSVFTKLGISRQQDLIALLEKIAAE